jgi:hypothetical protein
MPSNVRERTIAVLVRGLRNLESSLKKGEAHAGTHGLDPAALLGARLAGDMYDLAEQAHWAVEGARLAGARLVGEATSPRTAQARTFAELHEAIHATVAYLEGLEPVALEAGLEGSVVLDHRGASTSMSGWQFFLQLALPSLFFHATTAYGILRHQGVPVTKGDFIGDLG